MRLPADLASDEAQTLGFLRDEVDAADEATAALLWDLRFEHLDRAEDKVRRFMAECWADRSTDHVPPFVASHGAEVRKATCYIPVEFLSVTSVTEFPEVTLLPADDPQVPPPTPWFVLENPTGCVAAVEVEGSSFARMASTSLGGSRVSVLGVSHDARVRASPGFAPSGSLAHKRSRPSGRSVLAAGQVP